MHLRAIASGLNEDSVPLNFHSYLLTRLAQDDCGGGSWGRHGESSSRQDSLPQQRMYKAASSGIYPGSKLWTGRERKQVSAHAPSAYIPAGRIIHPRLLHQNRFCHCFSLEHWRKLRLIHVWLLWFLDCFRKLAQWARGRGNSSA